MGRFPVLVALFGTAVVASGAAFADERAATSLVEPNAALAACWWPPHRNVWTPIGWKDHLFRFNVLYNGTVLAQPHVRSSKKYSAPWAGQGVQLAITPSADGKIPPVPRQASYQLSSTADGGVGNQGWASNATPVLWTEWPVPHGLVLREEIFAHIPGAGDVKSGTEPLYAWIRLSVRHVDELQAPEEFSFLIHVGAVHVRRSMSHETNLTVACDRSAYPRKLAAENCCHEGRVGCRVREEDGRVRLVGISTDGGTFAFMERETDSRDYFLRITLPARKGASADLLVPMIPGDADAVDAELALGFDDALEQSDSYWSVVPETAARIETPEKQINEAIARSVKFASLITERNPETGDYSFLSGSGCYDALWATPTSMVSHMLLDVLGYYPVVEKHVEIFRANQGTVKPPGPSYQPHPGYFSTPKNLTSVDWLSDHGAILHQVSKHALLSGDQEFIDGWLDAIVKGCEFIRDARAIKKHEGVAGVLPPAVATDRKVPTQSVWNGGWNYRGLCTAVRLLRRVGHPQAEAFAAEARDYKEVFVRALRERTEKMPGWTDKNGSRRPIVPHSLSAGGDLLHPFYLDAGPLFLVWSGLVDARDELMRSATAYFREGPNTEVFDPRGNFHQRPVLVHEISSCEPCYSWNVYHSWQLGDRYRFLEGMYSLLAGALSRQTYISCETRHGIYGNVFASPLLVDLIRLSVIDDVIAEDELHLLRLVPKAWLTEDCLTRFENMPTEFGPVTICFKLSAAGKTLNVSYESRFRHQPKKVVLHVPPLAALVTVVINDHASEAKPGGLLTIE